MSQEGDVVTWSGQDLVSASWSERGQEERGVCAGGSQGGR